MKLAKAARALLPMEGLVGHAENFVLNPVLNKEPLDSQQGVL